MKKKQNRISALFAALLALAMLFGAVSCAGGEDQPGDSDTTAAAEVPTEPAETSTIEKSGLEIRDYTGKKMKVWYSTGSAWSPYPLYVTDDEGNCGDIVLEAGYQRNRYLENTLKLTLEYFESGTNPNGSGTGADLTVLRDLHQSGDIKEYDMVLTGATPAAQLAIEGFFLDIAQSDYIKPDADYYEKQMNGQLDFFGHKFFAAGYYSVMNTACIDVTYVNTDIIQDEDKMTLNDLYDLALNYQWTLEKMIELGKPYATVDVNKGDYTTDRYSMILSANYCQNIFYDLGGDVIRYNREAGDYDVTLGSTQNIELFGYIQQHLNAANGVSLVTNDNHTNAFMAKAAPFMVVTYNNLFKVRDADFHWAMLPTPLKAAGEKYCAYSDAWNLNFAGIPAGTADPDKAEYLYEAFMCASYDYVYPAYYETCFGTRYQSDAVGAMIFDLLNSSRVVCQANIFGLGSSVNNLVKTSAQGGAVSATIKGTTAVISSQLKKMQEKLQ